MKLKTMTVNGTKCDINVNEEGTFSCTLAGEWLTDLTLNGLVNQLKRNTKKTKVTVAVPASVLGQQWHAPKYGRASWVSGHSVRHVTLVGLDARGEVKFRDDKTGEIVRDRRWTRWNDERLVRRLTDAEVQQYEQLATAAAEADRALSAFQRDVALKQDPADLVREAIAEKIDIPAEDREAVEAG